MNERIKQLAEQSMSATFNKFSGVEWSAEEWRNFYDTKFAELIVRECASMTRNLSAHGELAEKAVKEHFGVE